MDSGPGPARRPYPPGRGSPDLAERLDDIRTALDGALPQAGLLPEYPGNGARDAGLDRRQRNAADLRRQMAREWDEVLAQVRKIAGFEHFLAAVPYADLAAAAVREPVVIVNASRHGFGSIVEAGRDRVRVVSLPDASPDTAVDHANAMLRALADADRPSQTAEDAEKGCQAVLHILEWLWDVIAGPVLTELGYTGTPATGDPWPRVWWCPARVMTLLPIHAAGHHLGPDSTLNGSGNCVLDRVISAYTPTLAALARARQPASRGPGASADDRHAHHAGAGPAEGSPGRSGRPRASFPSRGRTTTSSPGPRQLAHMSWPHLAPTPGCTSPATLERTTTQPAAASLSGTPC